MPNSLPLVRKQNSEFNCSTTDTFIQILYFLNIIVTGYIQTNFLLFTKGCSPVYPKLFTQNCSTLRSGLLFNKIPVLHSRPVLQFTPYCSTIPELPKTLLLFTQTLQKSAQWFFWNCKA